jgi:hypothetical protein
MKAITITHDINGGEYDNSITIEDLPKSSKIELIQEKTKDYKYGETAKITIPGLKSPIHINVNNQITNIQND